MQQPQGQGNAEAEQYINQLEEQVRSLRQLMKVSDRIVMHYAQTVDALNAAEQTLQIADVISQQYAYAVDAVNASQYALEAADQLINYTYPRSEALEPVAEVADMADSLVQVFANILLNVDNCADWYLELDPPRQPMVSPNAVPTAFTRPNFPAPPAPGGQQANNRDQLRSAWQRNPSQAWRAVDMMTGQDLTNLIGV
jgi:hypothetical protein